MRGIALWRIFDFSLLQKVLRGNASHPVWGKRLHPLTAAQK
jgi:hypothetical protein